jgi:hypothetical protein
MVRTWRGSKAISQQQKGEGAEGIGIAETTLSASHSGFHPLKHGNIVGAIAGISE